MKLFKLFLLGNLGLFSFVSCEDKVRPASDLFYLVIKDTKKTYTPNDSFVVSINNKKESPGFVCLISGTPAPIFIANNPPKAICSC